MPLTDPITLRNLLLQRGIRIEPHMAQYLARKLASALADDAHGVRVIGTDARTGVPIISSIDPRTLDLTGSA